jgi:transcriptional regulator with XRE-family HTH domain
MATLLAMAAKSGGILKQIGAEVRARRLALELGQEALAAKAGLHRNSIGMLERGERNVTILVLEAIADVLRVSVSDLLSSSERSRRT